MQRRTTFVVTIALALAVRLLGIATRPIWYDEAFAILFSEKGPSAMVHGTLTVIGTAAADVHPLGYYTLLWLWMRAFGESLVAVRLLSIVAGLGVIAIVMLLARVLFKTTTALAAGILAAFAPFQIHYAQEIRMYVFLCLWLLLATYAYWRASRSRGWTWLICFGIFAALAQYTQNLAAFYLLALAIWPLLTRNWKGLKVVVVGGGIAILLYLPWLVHLPSQFAKVEQGYWVLRPDIFRLFVLPVIFVVSLPVPDKWLALALFLGLSVVVIGLYGTVRAGRQKLASFHDGLWMLYLAFAPAVLMFLISQWKPVYLERALLPSGAIFCIWLAWAMLETQTLNPLHILTAALLLTGFGMGLREHLTNINGIYGPFQAIMQDLETKRLPGDVIIHSNKLSMLPSVYFDRLIPQTYVADPPGTAGDTLAPATQQSLGLLAQPDISTACDGASRVWFIIYEDANQAYIRAGQPQHPQLTWLMEHYSEMDVQSWEGLRVYLFAKSP
jgi:4-amino-4-deoxy-L-arabinose transferase-like glycosyltransferase